MANNCKLSNNVLHVLRKINLEYVSMLNLIVYKEEEFKIMPT